MEENKQDILNSLCFTLQQTRKFNDLLQISYIQENEKEYAILTFKNRHKKISITGDSGYAIIKDILK